MELLKEPDTYMIPEGKIELKNKFIELRSKGCSYRKIGKDLNISIGTLTNWDKELSEEIGTLKALQLEELYSKYYMQKEARIEQFGETLEQINGELDNRDFEDIGTDKLLDFKLKFLQALKEEYVSTEVSKVSTNMNATEIMQELSIILQKLKSGEITKDQAYKENYILMNILKAYDSSILEKKIEALETIIQDR